jgi:hypothetical protein
VAQGVELATGYVSLTVSARGIAQDISRELGDPVERASKEAGQSIEEGIGGGASRGAQAAKVALSAIGSAAILNGLNRAKDAASDLAEAANVTAITFGEAAPLIDEFAAGAAEALGQSERAAREAAAGFGGLLQNLGFTASEAAQTSIQLTTLGSDLASAFNTDPADAVAALGSALRGESEPIRRYNVLLNEQVLQQYALQQGLVDSLGPLDANTRATAALGVILQQTSRYQGDFANTSDGVANSQRITAAKMEDSAADIGEALIPIYAKLTQTVGSVADVFAGLPDPVQTGVLALAGLTAVAGPVTNLIGLYRSLRPATQAASAAVNAASSVVTNSADSFDELYTKGTRGSSALRGMAVAGGALAAVGLAAELYSISQAAGEVVVNLEEASGLTTDELVRSFGAVEAFFGRGEALDGFRQLAEGGEATAQAAVDLRDAYLAAGRDVSDFDDILAETADSQAISADRAADGADALGEFTSAAGPAADAQADLGDETRTTARQLFDWAGALDDGIRSLRDLYDLQTASSDVQAAFRDTLRDFTDVQEQSNEGTLTGQERLDAFRGVLSSGRDDILDMTEALFDQGQTTEEVIPQIQAMADELFTNAENAGLAGDAANFLRGELGLMPDQVDANIRSNVTTVLADFEQLRDAARAFGFQDLRIDIPLGPGSNFQARAGGGDFDPGWLLVGEDGPELMRVNTPGTVVSAPDTAAMLAGPASSLPPVTQQFYGKVDAADVGDATFREMRRLQMVGRT